MRKLRNILLRTIALLIFLLMVAWLFIQTPYGQNWIIGKVANRLSKDLNTTVSIKHVDFSLFNRMHLEGLMMEDRKKDTLLYAGDLKVRITDWFFLKEKIELKYIGLEDAVIKFNRVDSAWNHQFLIDYFSSPASSKKENKSGGLNLNLKKIELKNIRFLSDDKWIGEKLLAELKSLDLDARDINFDTKKIDIASLEVSEPVISMESFSGDSSRVKIKKIKIPVADSALKWNAAGWLVSLDKLTIKNGVYKNDKRNGKPQMPSFDGQHIHFSEMDGSLTNIKWYRDTITTTVDLKTKEHSGLEVKKLFADVKFTPQLMEFSHLDLQTNKSRLTDYFSMAYENLGAMSGFLNKVIMSGNFNNSVIHSDDIAFFAPSLNTWKKNITLTGKIKGTVEDIHGKNLLIKAGQNTLLSGDISLSGLPDINTTFIDFKSNDFRTTYADAVKYIPAIKKITTLNRISYLRFKGNFTGFIRDFVAYGTTHTNLGTIVSDINMKLQPGKNPVYSGNISSTGFELGHLLGDINMGAIALNAKLTGTGLNKNIKADIDGKIYSFVYNGYHYEEIEIKGKLNNQLFAGSINSKDSNAVFFANGTADFNSIKPIIRLDAEIQDIQFQKLRIGNQDYAFSGRLEFDFEGDNIDDFLGTAKIKNGKVYKNGAELPFENFMLKSEIINGQKKLTIDADELSGTVSGQFSLKELPAAITLFLNKYYPSFIPPPSIAPANQSFVFDIQTRNINPYLEMLKLNIAGFDNSNISGTLDIKENNLNIKAQVPYFSANGISFSGSTLTGSGNQEKLFLTGHAGSARLNDSISLQATDFTIEAANDISKVKITTGSNKDINIANINAIVTTFPDGLRLHFDSSYFDVNNKTWTIEKNGELEFRNNTVTNSQIILREGEQKILLSTEPSSVGNSNDLKVVLEKFNLGDLSPLLLPKNKVEGIASGTILIEDPARKFNIQSELDLKNLRYDNDSIGNLGTQINYNNATGIISGKGKNDNTNNKIDFDLLWHLNKADKDKENYIILGPENYPIKILEKFLGVLFSDFQGYATGKIKIGGKDGNINYTGRAKLHDAGLRVVFTQCFYKIEDTEIELRDKDINLDGIILRDPVSGNPIYLDGNISHYSFRDMFFDIRVQTRKPYSTGKQNNQPVLLLNTTYNDNKQFYGKAYGTGSLQLSGPQDDMFMQISAIASDKDSSHITIPPSRSRETGEADFLVERKFGREMSSVNIQNASSNILFDADITATPLVNMKVQIDDLTNDEITGRGEGTLNIRSGTTEPLTIRGRFNIIEGEYDYTFRSVFKKPFVVKKGVGSNNFIEWSGDPYKAKINFEASYTAREVSFAPLVNGYSLNSDLAGLRDDVNIVATMYNELFNPKFDFKIQFPDNSQAKNDPSILLNISQIQKNQNELNRQVTFLLVFNSFAPPETAPRSGLSGAFNELFYNSISGIIFNEVNNIINQALYKIFKTDKVKLDISGSVYNRNILNATDGSSSLSVNQGSINVNVPVSLFKDRMIVNAGFSSDISLQPGTTTNQNRVLILPNISIEFLINPSGSLRATIFYRENADFLSQSSTAKRQGVGVTYRREAARFWDLFSFGKNRNPKKEPEKTTSDEGKKTTN